MNKKNYDKPATKEENDDISFMQKILAKFAQADQDELLEKFKNKLTAKGIKRLDTLSSKKIYNNLKKDQLAFMAFFYELEEKQRTKLLEIIKDKQCVNIMPGMHDTINTIERVIKMIEYDEDQDKNKDKKYFKSTNVS